MSTLRIAEPVETEAEIKVESGIPMPAHNSRQGKYPWRAMAVGDSFFVPIGGHHGVNSAASISHGVSYMRKRYSLHFLYRTVIEDGIKGVRVWRVE